MRPWSRRDAGAQRGHRPVPAAHDHRGARRRPVCSAASAVTVPATVVEGTISGNNEVVSFAAAISSSTRCRAGWS